MSAQNETKVFRPYITLPYKGKEGEAVLKRLRNLLKTSLPPGVRPQFVYTGTKISSYFRVKDPVPLEHQSDLCYKYVHKEVTRYIGETNVRHGQRNYEHRHSDKKSSVYRFLRSSTDVSLEDGEFEVLETGLGNKLTRKLAESLHIKEFQPDLNINKKSFKLVLFN